MATMTTADFVIVGAGFAGAATAYHLARKGVRHILVVEQEKIAGAHASGRNAAMVRQCVSDPVLLALTRDGAAFLPNLPEDWPIPVSFKQSGSLLLGSGEGWERIARDAETGQRAGIKLECWSPQKAKSQVPLLRGARFDGAVWCPTDGIVDIHALLTGYLKGAGVLGARIRFGTAVREIEVAGGRVTGVATADEFVTASAVINAAGAWAALIGKMAGAVEVPLRPCRRHLFVTPPLAWADPKWPFVWDVSHDFYFRPESGGLLLCACDQDEMVPGDPPVDESVRELLAEKLRCSLPQLADVAIKKGWAGLRTLSADGRFIIGWDPKVAGFFWVAGLGGHGVTTSSSVGGLAADLILGKNGAKTKDFSPERFLSPSLPDG